MLIKYKKQKNWSSEVTQNSFALELDSGVFTWKNPRRIALSLKRSAEKSFNRKGTPFQSAMSMLNFILIAPEKIKAGSKANFRIGKARIKDIIS